MPKGDWNPSTTYDMLDLVARNGVAYLARQTNIGQDPALDTAMTYWQPFGSASAIATTSSPGLVMPDGDTIAIDGSGLINVNIDNNTIVYDSVNHYLKAVVSSALATLTDVNVTSAQNGQALIFDSTSQKWENTTVYGDGIALSSLDATTITSAIGTLQTSVGTLQGDMTTAQGDIDDLEAGNGVTTLSVDLTGWTSDTTSQSGTTLYKKQISVNHVYVDSPTVDIGSSGVLPTVAEQESYNLLQYCTVDDTVPCLYLYASAIPTTSFYISVTGVD
jgi:hypothetical protein